ncbi:hypothetical protein [Sphingomonas aracearum]|uniref:DUF3618 domain-containing protein n=1 Tax=Sphingomonas aracearum TaxID=2283317 RepID=A0A369VVM2_9SPHN|nr:hypothetical protein [Sphingomonas aracearum]RDE05112.1 hypothetical protein DVW87_07455 [Sphingomonas aracearum]
MSAPEVKAAQARADLAKARMQQTLAELQERARPANVAEDVKEAAVRNKVPLAGAAGALTLFMARKPLARALRRITRRSPDQQK